MKRAEWTLQTTVPNHQLAENVQKYYFFPNETLQISLFM